MSRCFPFPPPGYEKKARSDNVNLLAKEKHKEKTHKKEKRDKEKRESKERKEKDRSKDKHKEKKDRKEKHKDKKKDKERDKDKSRTSEDRRTEQRTEGHHEGKLGESSRKAEEYQDSKFAEELGRRIRDEERQAANRMVESFTSSTQRRIETMGSANAIEKERVAGNAMLPDFSGAVQTKNEGVGRQMEGLSSSVQRRIEGTTITMEKQRGTSNERIPDATGVEQRRNHGMGQPVDHSAGSIQRTHGMCATTTMSKDRRTVNSMASNPIATPQRRNDGLGRPGENLPITIQRRSEGAGTVPTVENERIGFEQRLHERMAPPVESLTSSIQRRIEGMGASPELEKKRVKENEFATNFIEFEQRRNDGMGQLVEKDSDKKIEAKEKTKDRKPEDGKGDRNKDRDATEKKSKAKDKDRHKEKKKEKEKMREKGQHKQKEHDKQRDNGKKDRVDNLNIKPIAPQKDNAMTVEGDGNAKKRKDFEINGFLHEKEARPNKLLRTTPSPLPPAENGRTLDLCHFVSACSSIQEGSANDAKAERALNDAKAGRALDNKENNINGIEESRLSPVELRPPVALDASENGKVSSRPPHPDSKYLSLIYSVPKMEEWPESDDQEWLFNSDNFRPKAKSEVDRTPQVWAEAMQIESADVLALPYVIPY